MADTAGELPAGSALREGDFQAGDLVGGPAVEALDVGKGGVDNQVVVHFYQVPVHGGDAELAHPHFLSHEISNHVVSHAQAGDFGETVRNGHGQVLPVTPGLTGGLHDALDDDAVDDVAVFDNAGADGDGLDAHHTGKGKQLRLARKVGRHGNRFIRSAGNIGLYPYIAGHGRHAVPDGVPEPGTDGHGHDDDKETDGDRCRRHVSLELKLFRYERFGYQMCTRSSSGRNILSPSWMSKASKKLWKLRMDTFTRFSARECTSRLVRRAFSWSVMFWAQMAP